MVDKTFCDVCGKEILGNAYELSVFKEDIDEYSVDLCGHCYQDWKLMMNTWRRKRKH